MAEKIVLMCDPCEGENEETRATKQIHFEVDGVPSVVDVCEGHEAEWRRLQDALKAFEGSARPADGAAAPKRRKGPTAAEMRENKAIREWARGQGIEMSARGRISEELRGQFRQATAAPKPAPADDSVSLRTSVGAASH